MKEFHAAVGGFWAWLRPRQRRAVVLEWQDHDEIALTYQEADDLRIWLTGALARLDQIAPWRKP